MTSLRGFSAAVALSLLAACSSRDTVRVDLQSGPAPGGEVRRVRVTAQVSGSLEGLRYKWFAVAGECDPQESSLPVTDFRFAPRANRDRVTLEVWRGSEQVARGELDVELDPRLAVLANEPPPNVAVEITRVPPYEPAGGPETRADIEGRVRGDLAPGLRIVVYARADAWYIQPLHQRWHVIRPDSTWGTWTHTGSSYAALIVRPDFPLLPRLDMLPNVGGDVVARTIVEGAR